MSNQPAWRVVPGSRFRWREWDDEFVLYHENSGDTHRLSLLGARALSRLHESPLGPDDLSAGLAAEFSLDADPQFAATISRLLAHLCDLGLVEPVTTDDDRKLGAV
jgi:PqqD family protein of HPr-rel-A system